MPHPEYISMATIHLNGYIESGRWGHRWRHVWRRGMTCSHNGDVGLKWLQLSHRVTGGSGSEASAVNNAPDVHRWLQIRPRVDFRDQIWQFLFTAFQARRMYSTGTRCVTTRRTSRFNRNQRVTNDYVSAGWCNSLKTQTCKGDKSRSLRKKLFGITFSVVDIVTRPWTSLFMEI